MKTGLKERVPEGLDWAN